MKRFWNEIKVTTVLSVSLFWISCSPEFSTPEAEKGQIDPTRFVCIGDDFTAGYTDGALYQEGQKNSYANILAEQLKLIGCENFTTPWISESSVGISSSGKSKSVLGYGTDCNGVSSLKPIPYAATGDTSAFNDNLFPSLGPFHNMGVPEAKTIDLVKQSYGNAALGSGNYNAFFARFASDPQITSVLDDATITFPTFYSVFTGINDVLAYAMKGGASNSITPSSGISGAGFDASLDFIINTLSGFSGQGVISTIPDVTAFPFFTTIPGDGLALDSANAALLNAIYNPIGMYFQIGKNQFVIEDTSAGMFGVRQIQPGELILLNIPLDSVKCFKMGSVYPIPNRYILTANEISNVRNAVSSYNAHIRMIANQKGLALVDAEKFFNNIKSGTIVNGISLGSQFVSGGIFSLDGVHLTARGNAMLANEFIKAINEKYQSKIPQVDATKYKGITFP